MRVSLDTPPDEFFWGVFVTALEGGIGYWFQCRTYRWSTGDGDTEDHTNFQALGRVDGEGTPVVIDKDTIELGLERILTNQVHVRRDLKQELLLAVGENDGGRVDIELADCVVQAGLLDDIVYG